MLTKSPRLHQNEQTTRLELLPSAEMPKLAEERVIAKLGKGVS